MPLVHGVDAVTGTTLSCGHPRLAVRVAPAHGPSYPPFPYCGTCDDAITAAFAAVRSWRGLPGGDTVAALRLRLWEAEDAAIGLGLLPESSRQRERPDAGSNAPRSEWAAQRPDHRPPRPRIGLHLLARDDAWWRATWVQYRVVATIADTLGIPGEDVVVRLRAAGVELRGRPPAAACWVPEVTPERARAEPGAWGQLLIPGVAL